MPTTALGSSSVAPDAPTPPSYGPPAASAPPSAPSGAGAEGGLAAAEGEGMRRLLLFAAGERVYGCDIFAIREIVPFRQCTRLPGAPAYVCGLINLRGTLVTVVDLAVRLGRGDGGAPAPDAASRTAGSVVLVEHGTKVVGLAVDQVRDVQAVAEAEMEPVSLAASEQQQQGGGAQARGGVAVFHASGQLDGEVVVLLDVHTILRQVLA